MKRHELIEANAYETYSGSKLTELFNMQVQLQDETCMLQLKESALKSQIEENIVIVSVLKDLIENRNK